MRAKAISAAAALVALAWGCAKVDRTPQLYTLPSGKQVKVFGVSGKTFPQSGDLFIVSYETAAPVDDYRAMREEAIELWAVFRPEAERAGLKTAALGIKRYKEEGVVRRGRLYTFVYARGDDGAWRLLNDERENR